MIKDMHEDILKFLLDNENGLFNKMKVVCANTQRTLRMVMNAIYSYLFNVEISDQPILAKNSKKGLTYTSMRELVAEVSEAHGADERDIYGIKSVASKQLISIKFDKILLRLADLLDMSSYRVSKPILYHNVEQMSEESAFHWISHIFLHI